MSCRKCFIRDLTSSTDSVWVQGVVVSTEEHVCIVDDSTGTLKLLTGKHHEIDKFFRESIGMYVLAMGKLNGSSSDLSLGVQRLIDLSSDPNREATWFAEVIDLSLRGA
jgi:hypothetical protein